MFEQDGYPYLEDVNLALLRLWGKRSGKRVLDVGCGYAGTSQSIQALGNHVVGIESSGQAADVAASRLERVITADLHDEQTVRHALGADRFDMIIFADVLEHLPWPVQVLRRYLEFLRPEGTVIISVPNAGLWSMRLAVLLGRFDYTDSGVLDATHLRFFTRRNLGRLLDAAGLEARRSAYNPGLVRVLLPLIKRVMAPQRGTADRGAILESAPYRIYRAAVHPIETAVASLWPTLLAFQFVTEAGRKR